MKAYREYHRVDDQGARTPTSTPASKNRNHADVDRVAGKPVRPAGDEMPRPVPGTGLRAAEPNRYGKSDQRWQCSARNAAIDRHHSASLRRPRRARRSRPNPTLRTAEAANVEYLVSGRCSSSSQTGEFKCRPQVPTKAMRRAAVHGSSDERQVACFSNAAAGVPW